MALVMNFTLWDLPTNFTVWRLPIEFREIEIILRRNRNWDGQIGDVVKAVRGGETSWKAIVN